MGSLRDLHRLKNQADLSDHERSEFTGLFWKACFNKDYRLAVSLIRRGADIKSRYGYWTPLTLAIADFPRLAHELLNYGANPNKRDGWGRSPLHVAVENGEYGLLRRLVKMGADLKARNDGGRSPLEDLRGLEYFQHRHCRLMERILLRAGGA